MTDEEKAEEYTYSINTLIYDIEGNAIDITKYLIKAYLDGLAEGHNKSKEESKQCIELLQNEKAELAEDFCKQLAELKAQIEKMKCCGNCKRNKLFIENGKLKCEGNIVTSFSSDTKINVCDKWELAE